jgi:ATP synthase protein I
VTTLRSVKSQAYHIVIWQLVMIVGLAVILFLLRGMQNGISTLLGGLAYWLPTLVFVWRVFARASMRNGKEFIVAFFAGEVAKLLLSAIFFVLIMKYLPVTLLPVLVGYVGAIVAFWVASVVFLFRHPGVSL